MHDLLTDLRYAVRALKKTPGVTIVAVLSLAFAIGTNTSVFSVAKRMLLETFRWEEPERVAFLFELDRRSGEDLQVAPGNFLDWREISTHFERMEAFTERPINLTGSDRPERLLMVETTVGLFELLGRGPNLGRGFRAGDGSEGGEPVVVLSRQFYESRFWGRDDALGSTLMLDGAPHTVIGVLPREFDFIPATAQVFRPIDLGPSRHDRDARSFLVLGRLRDGSGFHEAEAELAVVAERLAADFPDSNRDRGVNVQTLREVFPGETDTRLQLILLSVAGFVLVIACANLVNLFLSRADARHHEIALRAALGASRADIVRHQLAETLLVAGVGGAIGIVVSFWMVRIAADSMPAELPSVFLPRVDPMVLGFGIFVSLFAGVLLGALPAFQALRISPASALGESSRGGTASRKKRRLRGAFIVAETAAALALLTGAGVLSETFRDLVEKNGEINTRGVIAMELSAGESRYGDDAEVAGFYREVLRRVKETPGVQSATVMLQLPRSRAYSTTEFIRDDQPPSESSERSTSGWQAISPGYFETLEVPLRQGRGFAESDRADAPRVAIINEALVRRYFPEGEALGRRITLLDESHEIVGVAADFMQPRMALSDASPPAIFLPYEQEPRRDLVLAARTEGAPLDLIDALRAAIWKVDPDQPVARIRTLQQNIETELAGPRIIGSSLTVIGGVALLLSAIGMFGLISYDVSLRRREIGIRMAMGARPATVVRSITLQGLTITGIGTVIGLPLAWAMIRAIGATLSDVAPTHGSMLAGLFALLLGVAAVACYIPALRASRIEPAKVLQAE